MNLDDIQKLYAYNLWANQRMFSVLGKLSEPQLTAPVQSSFPSIHDSALHIFAAEWIWLKRWQGQSPRATVLDSGTGLMMYSALRNAGVDPNTLSTLPGLRSWADSLEQEREQLLRSLNEDRLHAPLQYCGMDGAEYSMPLVELMQHLVNHGTYHRGQITTLLRQIGAETVGLDLVFFFRERQAKASQAAD